MVMLLQSKTTIERNCLEKQQPQQNKSMIAHPDAALPWRTSHHRRRAPPPPIMTLHQVDREEWPQNSTTRIWALGLRRHSVLVLCMAWLMGWTAVDDYALLPTGLLLYAAAIPMALEAFQYDRKVQRLQRLLDAHQQQEDLDRAYQAALFEYRVLRQDMDKRIVHVQDPDGTIRLYAV